MTAGTELFEPDRIEAVATDHGVESETLAAALTDHQEAVEDLPGVENIVYEWRKQYEDPLVDRTETAYFLVVPHALWTEFADALELSDEIRDAVVEVHRRTVATNTQAPPSPADDQAYVALDRTV